MPKLRVLSAADVCRILRAHGFVEIRQRGSHIILRRQLPDRGITVPVPNHREIARGSSKTLSNKVKFPRMSLWNEIGRALCLSWQV
jgi:predicted RNA binding protein YcfA (HicA-like mRNA interferase family)